MTSARNLAALAALVACYAVAHSFTAWQARDMHADTRAAIACIDAGFTAHHCHDWQNQTTR